MQKKKPNILFIQTDQQRQDTLSCYGGDVCKTPNIDELANESVVFNNAYTSSPICTPARASLQTGLYPMHHGMVTNNYSFGSMVQELPDSPDLLSRRLEKQGYSVGYTGKWHLGTGEEELMNEPGYDEYMSTIDYSELRHQEFAVPTTRGYEGDDFPGHGYGGFNYQQYKDYLRENNLEYKLENIISGNYDVHQAATVTSPVESTVSYFLTDRAIKHIEEFSERGNPWYFQLNFWGPHEPYFAQKDYLDMYKDIEIEPWPNFYDNNGDKPKIHDVKRANSREWKDFELYVRHYFAFMTMIDDQVGRVIQYLKDNDLYENTIIIFSSDHGESLGIHGGLSDKAIFMYEETCKIPLLIKMNGENQQHHVENRLVGTCDLYSTILECSGLPNEAVKRDGASLVPLINQTAANWREAIVTECSGIDTVLFTQRLIRKGNWKYVFNAGDIDELYNLTEDPYEMVNLVNKTMYQDVLNRMQDTLEEWMVENRDRLIKQFRLLRDKN